MPSAEAVWRWASATTRRASPGAWWLVHLLGTPEGARDFDGLYAYFRWADDRIDAPGRDPAATRDFAQAQAQKVAALTRGEPAALLELPERALGEALRGGAPRLLGAVERMFAALRFDAHRGADPLSPEELDAQLVRVGDAYTLALLHACAAPEPVPAGVFALARAATAVHHLRDLELDLGLGYLNLPAAHAAPLGVDPRAPTPAGLRAYRLARAPAIHAEFERGLAALGGLRSWPGRALLRAFAWRYQRALRALAPA